MHNRALHNQPPLRLQHLLDILIRRLHMHALPVRHLLRELPRVVHGARRHLVGAQDAVRDRDPVVVLAERGRLVHDARAVFGGDVGVGDDAEGAVFELRRRTGQVLRINGSGKVDGYAPAP